jgi:uncharacterized protein involved in exopolysaccharide biosynthesis
MSTPRFDLVDVTQTLRNRRRFIILIVVITAVLGGVFYMIGEKEYKAEASFLMTNPMYTDRNNLFQDRQIQFVDYFAGDNDVDRLVSLAESDTIKYLVADRLNLAAAYKLDMSKPKDVLKLKNIFKGNYKLNRTEYNNCTLSYTDTDPVRAAAVANECVKAIEEVFRGYYVSQRNKVIDALQAKIRNMDSTINIYTDSLASVRDRYKIYDIINPSRENLVSSGIKSNGSADFGKAMETVQNVESMKDQLVSDRSRYLSLLNQNLTTIAASDNPVIHSLTTARVPAKPKGIGLLLTIIASAMVGFFFSSLYILITTYYRLLIAVER